MFRTRVQNYFYHGFAMFHDYNFGLYIEERETSLRDLTEWNVAARQIASLTAAL